MKKRLAIGIVALMCAASAEVHAQSEKATEAQHLFDEAMALMKAKNYAAACPKLARSQELDPGAGTQYRLGECLEAQGRITSAWTLFVQVADEAKRANRADREEQARTHADSIRPRLPMIVIHLAADLASLPGVEIKRDGELVSRIDYDQKVPVDPGDHLITAHAPGKKDWQQAVHAEIGSTASVNVPALDSAASASSGPTPAVPVAPASASPSAAPPTETPAPAPQPSGGLGGQRIAAIVVGVVGLAGIGVGVGFALKAKSDWNDALSHCAGGDHGQCDAQGVSGGSSAHGAGNVATVGFIVGAVGLVGAGVLYATAPRRAKQESRFRVVPDLSSNRAGAVLLGRF